MALEQHCSSVASPWGQGEGYAAVELGQLGDSVGVA